MNSRSSEWLALHAWQLSFRNEHDISIEEFLDLCILPADSSYFRLLCSPSGSKMALSKKPNSLGWQYIEAVRVTKQRVAEYREDGQGTVCTGKTFSCFFLRGDGSIEMNKVEIFTGSLVSKRVFKDESLAEELRNTVLFGI